MTDIFKPVWPLLEAVDPTITPAGWRRLPPATRQVLESSGLAKLAGFADRIPCPICTTPHTEMVITKNRKDGSTQYFIRCPREMRVEVDDHDRQRWRLDVFALAKAIAGSAGLTGQLKAMHGDQLIHLGKYEFRGVRTEVYLARGLGRKDASSIISALPTSVVPAIVFVPSKFPPEDAWGQMPPRVFSLSSCHTYIDGTIGIDLRVIEAAARRHLRGDLTPDYVFRCRGDFWEVAFDASEVKHLKDSIGLRYIARILREPGRVLRAVDLLATEAGINPLSASGTSGEAIDDEGRRRMRQEYFDLQEEFEEAEKLNDEARMIAAQSKRDALTVEISSRLNLSGNAREASDADRVRKSVSVAIGRGKTQISNRLPDLGTHLNAYLDTGSSLKYAPPEPIDWILD